MTFVKMVESSLCMQCACKTGYGPKMLKKHMKNGSKNENVIKPNSIFKTETVLLRTIGS